MSRLRWFKLILISLAGLTLSVFATLHPATEPTWQPGHRVAPTALLEQVVRDNLAPGFLVDPGQMAVLRIHQPRQAHPLYLMDARLARADIQPFCGAAGCAVWGYRPDAAGFQRVFSAYLNPHLPPGTLLIQPSSVLENGLPQLTLHQLDGTILQQLTLAFNGQSYIVAQLDYLPVFP